LNDDNISCSPRERTSAGLHVDRLVILQLQNAVVHWGGGGRAQANQESAASAGDDERSKEGAFRARVRRLPGGAGPPPVAARGSRPPLGGGAVPLPVASRGSGAASGRVAGW